MGYLDREIPHNRKGDASLPILIVARPKHNKLISVELGEEDIWSSFEKRMLFMYANETHESAEERT